MHFQQHRENFKTELNGRKKETIRYIIHYHQCKLKNTQKITHILWGYINNKRYSKDIKVGTSKSAKNKVQESGLEWRGKIQQEWGCVGLHFVSWHYCSPLNWGLCFLASLFLHSSRLQLAIYCWKGTCTRFERRKWSHQSQKIVAVWHSDIQTQRYLVASSFYLIFLITDQQ